MNFFEEAEKILKNIPVLKDAVKNLEERERLIIRRNGPSDCKGINYNTDYVSKSKANDSLKELLELKEIQRERSITQDELNHVNDITKQLSTEQQELIYRWYELGNTKEVVCHDMHIASLSTLYALKNKTVTEFAIRYFGASAMKQL